jgi:hypothetical protein
MNLWPDFATTVIGGIEPRFCSWLQNLPEGPTKALLGGFVGVNPDQNAKHFASILLLQNLG